MSVSVSVGGVQDEEVEMSQESQRLVHYDYKNLLEEV